MATVKQSTVKKPWKKQATDISKNKYICMSCNKEVLGADIKAHIPEHGRQNIRFKIIRQ